MSHDSIVAVAGFAHSQVEAATGLRVVGATAGEFSTEPVESRPSSRSLATSQMRQSLSSPHRMTSSLSLLQRSHFSFLPVILADV